MSDITTWLNNESLETFNTDENFNNKEHIHDWKNYVPPELVLYWDNLTMREKNIIKVLCNNIAREEDWD